jgi:hypothetical protein
MTTALLGRPPYRQDVLYLYGFQVDVLNELSLGTRLWQQGYAAADRALAGFAAPLRLLQQPGSFIFYPE